MFTDLLNKSMNYQKHYNRLVERSKNRQLDCYTESHHILPRCMGGDNSTENLVNLTPEEHYIAHLLLVKIYPKHHGLVWAAIQMTGHHTEHRSSNKMYGWLRRKIQKIAKARTGEKNGSTGTIWINKSGTIENRKIRKDDPIPDGWVRGRKFKVLQIKTCKLCKVEFKARTHKHSTYCSRECQSKDIDRPSNVINKMDKLLELYDGGMFISGCLKELGFDGTGTNFNKLKSVINKRDLLI